VFRELATQPIGRIDYLLGAAQGIVSWLALSRAQSAGAGGSVMAILGKAILIGPIAGVLGLYLMAAIYTRLGNRAGGVSTRTQIFHVLAYSGVPMLASLGLWLIAALFAGEPTFIEPPRPDLEPFLALILEVQFIAHIVLIAWSLLLQVMGFSEVEGFAMRRAFGIWVLGQVLVALAMFLLAIVIYGTGLGSGTAPG
jgi:hypothetical protein